jgi:hypothetical protein
MTGTISPLPPPGCNAVIYEAPESQGSKASHSTDALNVGPSLDHYQCNQFFVPDTRAYQVSGLAELFPQHCQVPFLMWNKHLQEVIDKLVTSLHELPPEQQSRILSHVMAKLSAPPPVATPRRLTHPSHEWLLSRGDIQLAPFVPPSLQVDTQWAEQRVNAPNKQQQDDQIDIPMLTKITDALPIMNAPNPTQKRTLKLSKRTHSRQTRNKIPGSVPQIMLSAPHHLIPTPPPTPIIAPQ